MTKIVIDNEIPFIRGVLEPFAEVKYVEGESMSHSDIRDADAIVIRTRTRCDRDFLEGTSVKLISTATIGTGHIDRQWCEDSGIFVQNSSGCNAGAVMNYVASALYGTAARRSIPLSGATFGIIGAGHVGKRIDGFAKALGFKVLLCDPVRAEKEGPGLFCTLDELLESSDIVCLTPVLNDFTRRMADASFFAKMRLGAFFINPAAGELVVDADLIDAIPKLGPVVIDAWNGEPEVNRQLMNLVDIATPHIAGYSYQGKQMSTAMAVRAVARFFGYNELYEYYPPTDIKELEAVKLDLRDLPQGQAASIIQYNYPIFTDDFMFRINPSGFTDLRNNYSYRREFYIE